MQRAPRPALAGALVALLLTAACGGGGTSEPSAQPPLPAVANIPTAPAPQPTATPTPGPELDEPPAGTPGGGGGEPGTCGPPLPPPVSRIAMKIHQSGGERVLLDSTPLVSDGEYCRAIGFTDGRTVCPVRMEGNPERSACEALRVGRASDTGRPGPTWSANGKRCDGPDGGTACLNHSENQYLAWAYGSGTFRACAASGVCGELAVP